MNVLSEKFEFRVKTSQIFVSKFRFLQVSQAFDSKLEFMCENSFKNQSSHRKSLNSFIH